MDQRLMLLRVQLYTAAQSLTGEDADEFWKLIQEIQDIRVLHQRAPREAPGT